MIKKIFYLGFIPTIIFASCVKEGPINEVNVSETSNHSEMMSFATSSDLQAYVDGLQEGTSLQTKSSSSFVSLWDYQQSEFMETLDDATCQYLASEGLVYEPEDELIVDPYFARVLSPAREIQVGNKVYRYVPEGILIYVPETPTEALTGIDLSIVKDNEPGSIVELGNGISFQKIIYAHLEEQHPEIETKVTVSNNTSISNQGIVLGGGINIPASDIQRVVYEQSASDANGFSQWVSGIFGTNVVAIKEFDSKHRIRMRTFSQEYGIYRSVGMAVKLQQKVLGSWFRYKAEEIRYGWTAVECIYRYRDPIDADFRSATRAVIKDLEGYDKPVVFFKSSLNSVKNASIKSAVSSILSSNSSTVNNWISANPSYRENPRGVMTFDYSDRNGVNTYDKIRLIFPQTEEVVYNDRREKVSWDFNWFPTLNSSSINASGQYTDGEYMLTELQDITVNRGEFYGAVKYDGKWKACVIYNN